MPIAVFLLVCFSLALWPSSVLAQQQFQPGQSAGRVVQRPVLPPAGRAGPQNALASLALSKLFEAIVQGRRPEPQMLRLASFDANGAPWLLRRDGERSLTAARRATATEADWWVAPASRGYVRLETYNQGRVRAITASQAGRLFLDGVTQDPRQLWRVRSAGGVASSYFLESVAFPGRCFARHAGGIALQPLVYGPGQLWTPYVAPVVPTFQPFWRTVNTEVMPGPPLPPAEIALENSHRYALIVLVGDVRTGPELQQIRIEPGTAATVALERDPGATLVETVEIRSPGGLWEQQQYTTAIPPSPLYDLSVYEEHLQSIAIDATGKSPNPIEDVNYVPKSVGWLPLPANLPAQGRIDVYARAKAANNPGAVRRFDPRQFDEQPATNPLEELLEKFQSTPRKKF